MDKKAEREFAAWSQRVRIQLIPKIQDSALTLSLVPPPGMDTDIKFAVELGLSIMLDKPIIAIIEPGQYIPERLRRVCDEVIEADLRNDPAAAAEIVKQMLDRREWGDD